MKSTIATKKLLLLFIGILFSINIFAVTHKILVWSGYFIFMNEATGTNIASSPLTIQLGDTIQFLPLDPPTMMHTITSTTIPAGATAFDQIWQLPADTFFQYIPAAVGVYNFECTPHVSMNMIGSFTVVAGNVGISDSKIPNDFTVFPNPANQKINIKVNNTLLNKTFAFYNVLGNVVLTGKINDLTTTLCADELIPGIYFLMIDEVKKMGLKIIKE